jgi:dUTP pyrophosphatase
MKRVRGFEIAKGWEDKDIHLPVRSTAHSAGYDIAAAEDVVIPKYEPGIKPTLIPTGLKAYCGDDECFYLLNRSSGPKKGFILANGVGLIDSDYYENPDNDGHFLFAYFNCSDQDILVKKGELIGQLVFSKYLIVDGDTASGRRNGGFGSTDKK